MFSPQEQSACQELIRLALAEDLGDRGDVTSAAVIPEQLQGRAVFLVKAAGVVAGLHAVELVMKTVDATLRCEAQKHDGECVTPGDRLATVSGSMRSILAAERTALNFLQHLSGIATLTRQFVDAIAGTPAKILDTRKTLPGWRLLEKYAVRQGGGHNHRLGLHDGILIKDNHLAALPNADRIYESVQLAWTINPKMPIEIEVQTLLQFVLALDCRPAIILLDNMTLDDLRKAVGSRNAECVCDDEYVLLEASGGVNLQTVRAIAETGVDRISVGALTHSAPALDIALDYES